MGLDTILDIGLGIMTGSLIAFESIQIKKDLDTSYLIGVLFDIFIILVSISTMILFLSAEITF